MTIPTMQSPVYILGHGCIAAPGYGVAALLAAWRQHWVPPVAAGDWAIAGHAGQRVGVVTDFDPAVYLKMRGLRPLSRASRLACVAAAAALRYPEPRSGPAERYAVIAGTRWASIEPMVEFNRSAFVLGAQFVSPAEFPNVVVNAHAGYLGILFSLAGPNITLCGPSAGSESITQAVDLLQLNRADSVLAGGVEAMGPTLLHGFARDGELDSGLIPGEGAAFVVLTRAPLESRPALARIRAYAVATAHSAADLQDTRLSVLAQIQRAAGMPLASLSSTWYAGDPPDIGCGTVLRSLRSASGETWAAGGALAVVIATHVVATSGSTVLVTDFPRIGAQIALLISPP